MKTALLLLSLPLAAAAQSDAERRIDDLFKGRPESLTGELHDLIIHEIAHDRRLRDAEVFGTVDDARAAAKAASPGVVMNERGESLERGAMWADLGKATVVFFGETHDHPACHALELETVQKLDGGKGDLSVGLEMFPKSLQPVLDRWTAGELTEFEFLEGVNWYKTWGFPYPLFRPIFLYCRDHKIPLVGLNVEADLNRKVGRTGLKSLTAEERAKLPDDIALDNRAHRRNFEETMPHHPGMRLETFYEAFCVWDETMADSAAKWLQAHGGRMVVIAGSGHIRRKLGIPDRLKKRFKCRTRVLLVRDVGDEEDNFDFTLAPGADWVVWTKEEHAAASPKLGVAMDEKLAVTTIAPGSAAEKAGLKVGDVLKRAGKRALSKPESIRHYLEIRTKETFTLHVERDGEDLSLKVTVPLQK